MPFTAPQTRPLARRLAGFGLGAALPFALAWGLGTEAASAETLREQAQRLRLEAEHPERNRPADPIGWLVAGGVALVVTLGVGFWKWERQVQASEAFWKALPEDPNWNKDGVRAWVQEAHEALRLSLAPQSEADRLARLGPYFSPELLAEWAPRWARSGMSVPEPLGDGFYLTAGKRAAQAQHDLLKVMVNRPLPHRLLFDDTNEDPVRCTWVLKPKASGEGWIVSRIHAGFPADDELWVNER